MDETITNKESMELAIKNNLIKTIAADNNRVYSMMVPTFYSCDFNKKELTLSYHVLEWELNPNGIMHGGIITTAFDNTFGMLSRNLSGTNNITTVNIAVSFLKPVPLGTTLLVTATANSVGRTIISMTATAVIKGSEVLVGTANSTFMILNNKPDPNKHSYFKC